MIPPADLVQVLAEVLVEVLLGEVLLGEVLLPPQRAAAAPLHCHWGPLQLVAELPLQLLLELRWTAQHPSRSAINERQYTRPAHSPSQQDSTHQTSLQLLGARTCIVTQFGGAKLRLLLVAASISKPHTFTHRDGTLPCCSLNLG